VAKVVTTTAEADPNNLLGRPGQYTARITFTVPGTKSAGGDQQSCDRGGCIEQWPNQAAAQKRADYIKQLGERLPFAVEYNTARPDGLLLRISRAASPAAAKKIQDAFAAL